MRKASIERKTKETDINLSINIDGVGISEIDTGIPFFDHMIEQLARHGFFDIKLKAIGDNHIDYHHTVEDVGIALGQAFNKALGDKKGIKRFASVITPLDEASVQVSLDISGRPHLTYTPKLMQSGFIKDFDAQLFNEFWQAFVNNANITLHIVKLTGINTHHIVEASFKGVAQALDAATQIDPRRNEIPSTKGTL